MEETYEFIRNNWPIIVCLWNDRDDNSLGYCNPCIYSRIKNDLRVDDTFWSCFFAAGFILDIYGVYNREVGSRGTLIKNITHIIETFEPGYIYNFSILDHEFTVIYQHDNTIYYCDYYRETGRNLTGSKVYISELYDLFRLEEMSYESIIEYLTAYLTGDIEYHTKFHHGDINYYESYLNVYNSLKQRRDSAMFIGPYCQKFEITFQPTIPYIIEVLEHSVDNVSYDEIDDASPKKIKKWLHTRGKLLKYLKSNSSPSG